MWDAERIGINGSQIWAVYTIVNAIYFEQTADDVDVFGNSLPNTEVNRFNLDSTLVGGLRPRDDLW